PPALLADQRCAAAAADRDVHVLDAAADYDEEHSESDAVGSDPGVVPADDSPTVQHVELTGLHAKTVVLDHPGGQSSVITGSDNLTHAAWQRNVEFNAILNGPTKTCGVVDVIGSVVDDMGAHTTRQTEPPVN